MSEQRWSVHLGRFPYWNQRTDWTADSRPDENRFNNCLAESMAMVIKHITNLELPADYIHDTMPDRKEGYIGYLNWNDAKAWFKRYLEIDVQYHEVTTEQQLTWWVWWTLNQKWHGIGLYYFNGPNDVDANGTAKSGHFRPWTGASGLGTVTDHITTADPWTGLPRTETPKEHFEWSQNSFIIIPRIRAISSVLK